MPLKNQVLKIEINKYVLDASGIINTNVIDVNKEYFTIPEVIYEIKDFRSKTLLFSLIKEKKLIVLSPSKKSINKIKKTATKLKCYSKLSNTDIKIIALAHELDNVILLTDDKYIQKVCNKLEIPFSEIIYSKFF